MKKISLLILVFSWFSILQAQVLTSVNPNMALQNQTLQVAVSGQNTYFNQGTSTAVWFSQGSSTYKFPTSITVTGPDLLIAQFGFNYGDPPGYYDVNVYDDVDGMIWLPASFFLAPGGNPPQLVSVNPDNAHQAQLLTVSISGQNTSFQQASQSVWFNQGSSLISAFSYTPVNDTILLADFFIPLNQPTGLYSTNVWNQLDGNMTLPSSFTVTPNPFYPALTMVNPDTVQGAPNADFTIHSTQTHFTTCWFFIVHMVGPGGTDYYPLHWSAVNDSTIYVFSADLSGLPQGWYNVIVKNDWDGELVLNNALYINQFAIGINPLEDNQFRCFPNPFTSQTYLTFPSSEVIQQIRCYQANGQLVLQSALNNQASPLLIGTARFTPGLYYLQVVTKDKTLLIKMLKQ